MGAGVGGGMQGKGGQQDSQVYYDSTKGQYYTLNQPTNSRSPLNAFFNQSGMPGKGGTDGRTYIGNSLNNTNGVNSLQGYQAPQFQYQQNPYTIAQYSTPYNNPYAQTQFGQMPMQQPNQYGSQYYQGPFQQYGMGGKGGTQQNPYTPQQSYSGSQIGSLRRPAPSQPQSMGGKGKGGGMSQ